MVEIMVCGQHSRLVHDRVTCDENIEHQRFVGRMFQRESQRDLLPVLCVPTGSPCAVTEFQHLRRTGYEEVRRCSLNVPQSRSDEGITRKTIPNTKSKYQDLVGVPSYSDAGKL